MRRLACMAALLALSCLAGGSVAGAAEPAAPFSGTYQVLSASFDQTINSNGPGFDGTPCTATSANSSLGARIDQQPIEPGNHVEVGPDNVSRGMISASGPGTVTTTFNGCRITVVPPEPCTHASSGEFGAGWTVSIEAAPRDTMAKLTWMGAIPGRLMAFGDDASCQLLSPFFNVVPPTTSEPVAKFLSSTPQTISVSASVSTEPASPVSGSTLYTMSLTIRRVDDELSIRTTPASPADENNGSWPFSYSADWTDTACTDPNAGTASPLAYSVIGTDRRALTSLLKSPQSGLAGRSGFAANAFRLGNNAKRVTAGSKSEKGGSLEAAAGALHRNNGSPMKPGNGVFFGARIACKTGKSPNVHEVAIAEPRVLCRNRPELKGEAWTKLTDVMRAKLTTLYALLRADDICFALSSGYRSEKEQQDLYDDWHKKADRPDPADRTQKTLNQLCPGPNGSTAGGPLGGFLQCPTGWDQNGKAKNGPAAPGSSRHNVGEAADLKLAFGALTGKFDPDAGQRKADVRRYFNGYALRVAGLCGSPPGDLGHVELPYSPGVATDPITGDIFELPPRCNFGPGPGTARHAAKATAKRKRRATRKSAPALAAARKKVDALGRRFALRSLTDEYVDWTTGACRKRGKGALCKLTVHGEGAKPYDCRTQVGVVKKGRRLLTLLYGRKTRCR